MTERLKRLQFSERGITGYSQFGFLWRLEGGEATFLGMAIDRAIKAINEMREKPVEEKPE